MSESREHCSEEGGCPFACSEESEIIQNYGCLPTRQDIVYMRTKHKKTWACHSNPDKPCLGALKAMREKKIDCSIVDPVLQTEKTDWGIYCVPEI